MYNIDNYEEQYFTWLSIQASNEEFFNEIVAIINKETCEEIMYKVSKSLNKELLEIEELIELATLDELSGLLEIKENLNQKKKMLTNIVNEYTAKQNHYKDLEKFGASGVLFATNSYGNIMIENDLEKIRNSSEPKVYDSFIELIELLVENEKSFISKLQKPVQKDSEIIKDLFALKDFQARLIYRYEKDYIVIIGVTLKKTTLDQKYRRFCVNCKVQSDDYVNKIRDGKSNIDDLIKQSTEYFSKISNKKGKKI